MAATKAGGFTQMQMAAISGGCWRNPLLISRDGGPSGGDGLPAGPIPRSIDQRVRVARARVGPGKGAIR